MPLADAIYMDYAAATPLDERVFAVMQPYFSEQFFNPSSPYAEGRAVRRAVNEARASIAALLGAKPGELLFTAGATESINVALYGVCAKYEDAHAVTTAVEHAAVLSATKRHDVTIVGVAADTGLVAVSDVTDAITDQTVIVSIGYANGEIGTVQPLRAVARALQAVRNDRLKRGISRPLYFHTDASQAAGLLDLHVDRLGVDLLTLNAGKCYGPKQVGLLYHKSPLQLAPLILGGGQEAGVRSGTENVAGIIGFAKALELAEKSRKQEGLRLGRLRDKLQRELLHRLPDTVVSGHPRYRLPNVLHAAWPGLDGERLLFGLDEHGIMVSTGSACAANRGSRSHVLEAIGLTDSTADGSIRLSLGRHTSETDIARTADMIDRLAAIERSVR